MKDRNRGVSSAAPAELPVKLPKSTGLADATSGTAPIVGDRDRRHQLLQEQDAKRERTAAKLANVQTGTDLRPGVPYVTPDFVVGRVNDDRPHDARYQHQQQLLDEVRQHTRDLERHLSRSRSRSPHHHHHRRSRARTPTATTDWKQFMPSETRHRSKSRGRSSRHHRSSRHRSHSRGRSQTRSFALTRKVEEDPVSAALRVRDLREVEEAGRKYEEEKVRALEQTRRDQLALQAEHERERERTLRLNHELMLERERQRAIEQAHILQQEKINERRLLDLQRERQHQSDLEAQLQRERKRSDRMRKYNVDQLEYKVASRAVELLSDSTAATHSHVGTGCAVCDSQVGHTHVSSSGCAACDAALVKPHSRSYAHSTLLSSTGCAACDASLALPAPHSSGCAACDLKAPSLSSDDASDDETSARYYLTKKHIEQRQLASLGHSHGHSAKYTTHEPSSFEVLASSHLHPSTTSSKSHHRVLEQGRNFEPTNLEMLLSSRKLQDLRGRNDSRSDSSSN